MTQNGNQEKASARGEELIREAASLASRARSEIGKRIVGKDDMVRGILTGLIARGHVLLEGLPGLAKTLAVRTLAEVSGLAFSRVQFTPDLLPADITGSLVYEQGSGNFIPREGPVFTNLLLADEINRAPAKVQSALLEAMEEGQVTIGDSTRPLPRPFFVLATQNPIEHEGTYPLPEAQLDRFLLKIRVGYPDENEELEILRRAVPQAGSGHENAASLSRVLGPAEIAALQNAADALSLDMALAAYLVRLVRATRPGAEKSEALRSTAGRAASAAGPGSKLPREALADLERWVEYGASPRAAIHLARAARACALIEGRSYVLPEDIKSAAPAVLRHRLVLSYEAEAEGVCADEVIGRLLAALPLP